MRRNHEAVTLLADTANFLSQEEERSVTSSRNFGNLVGGAFYSRTSDGLPVIADKKSLIGGRKFWVRETQTIKRYAEKPDGNGPVAQLG